MINIEELFASAGVSVGAYAVYKVGFRFYQKYYLSSECNHPTPTSTDIIVHISEAEEKAEVEMERGVEPQK
jgi:hypothetical protein